MEDRVLSQVLASADNGGLQEFENQIHGHGGILSVADKKVILKQLIEREHSFYEGSNNQPLVKRFLPKYYGALRLDEDSVEEALKDPVFPLDPTGIETRSKDRYICLENLVYGFENPCIADIKMGKQMYDLDAPPEKVATMLAIDFGHGHWLPGEGPDEQYLFGLDNFIRTLREILNEEYEH